MTGIVSPAYRNGTAVPAARTGRLEREDNLPETIIVAFRAACDCADLLVAERLLGIFETAVAAYEETPGFDRVRALATLADGRDQLGKLKNG